MRKSYHFLHSLLILLFITAIASAQATYTAYNIWYTNPAKVQAINFKTGEILPAGTEVTNIKINKGRRPFISFTVISSGKKFKISYNSLCYNML